MARGARPSGRLCQRGARLCDRQRRAPPHAAQAAAPADAKEHRRSGAVGAAVVGARRAVYAANSGQLRGGSSESRRACHAGRIHVKGLAVGDDFMKQLWFARLASRVEAVKVDAGQLRREDLARVRGREGANSAGG
eukprot:200494-Chlamydomonas_euryale.AAC.1